MRGIYRVTLPDGSTQYTDKPDLSGDVATIRADGRASPAPSKSALNPHQAEQVIKAVRTRVPKIIDYLDYLQYLRTHSPVRFTQALQQLKTEDPQAYLKLQRFPQFRPLFDTVLGRAAVEKNFGMGLALIPERFGGSFSGSAERWLETTMKDMMKRDRFGPYAEVLGSQATTLPAAKAPSYSSSTLGQYLKTEDPRLLNAAKQAAADVKASRALVRGALASALSRPVQPILDIGLKLLDPKTATSNTTILMSRRLDKVALRNPAIDLDTPAHEAAESLLSQGRFAELDRLLKQFE